MTWTSADSPPDNSRTVLVIKRSTIKGAATLALDFRFNGAWYNSVKYGYQVIKWMEAPKFDEG